MGRHIQALSSMDAVLVFHKDLPATIRVRDRNCHSPLQVCRMFSLLWQRIPGEREDTYDCQEFPIRLIVEKEPMRREVIREDIIFTEPVTA